MSKSSSRICADKNPVLWIAAVLFHSEREIIGWVFRSLIFSGMIFRGWVFRRLIFSGMIFRGMVFSGLIFSGLILLTPAVSQAQQAGSVYRFLYLDSHARSAALGGAHPAMPGAGYDLMHVNPAFLSPQPERLMFDNTSPRTPQSGNASPDNTSPRTPQSGDASPDNTSPLTPQSGDKSLNSTSTARSFQSTYLNHLDDIQYLSASIPVSPEILPLPARIRQSLPALALSVRAIHYGELTGYDEDGNDTGALSAGEFALTAGMADRLHDQVHWGVSLTYIHSGLAGYRSGGAAVSAGLHILSRDQQTSFGISLLNAGTQITAYQQTREPMPLQIQAGVSQRLQYLPFRYYITARYHPQDDLRTAGEESISAFESIGRSLLIGGEIYFGNHVTLRLGYDYLLSRQAGTDKRVDTAGLSGGLGIQLKRFDLHIARTSLSDLGGVLQLSVMYRF